MSDVEKLIEDLVYEHLIDLVDFDRMSSLEQVVALKLYELQEHGQLGSVDEEQVPDRAAELMERAWHRVIEDPRRYVDFRGDWQPADDCELCKALAASDETAVPPHRSPS